jgi:hypothetical protein
MILAVLLAAVAEACFDISNSGILGDSGCDQTFHSRQARMPPCFSLSRSVTLRQRQFDKTS